MNFLAHLYIAELTETSFAGAILGDFVRGRLDGSLPPALEQGVYLHRRVDSFTDSHPVVLATFARLPRPYRRYAGILVDVYFDHILAREWTRYHDDTLETFAERATDAARRHWPERDTPFPAARLAALPERLIGYRHSDGITAALAGLERRLSRPSPLIRALPVLQEQHTQLAADFDRFFPALLDHVQQATAVYSSDTRARTSPS